MDVYEELKQLKDGVYCAIGTFRAKKKDIVGLVMLVKKKRS